MRKCFQGLAISLEPPRCLCLLLTTHAPYVYWKVCVRFLVLVHEVQASQTRCVGHMQTFRKESWLTSNGSSRMCHIAHVSQLFRHGRVLLSAIVCAQQAKQPPKVHGSHLTVHRSCVIAHVPQPVLHGPVMFLAIACAQQKRQIPP